ncbi:intracellular hyaluronan-binding protein 4-like [Styela clava]
MPAIQDIYSVNVSNRYDIGSEPDDESDTAADYDPLDTLKTLEDQKKSALEEAKKKKQALANRPKNQKKPTRFQENKDSNVPPKKDAGAPKSAKPGRQNDRSDGPRQNSARRPRNERQNYGEGDENRRPPRRRNDHPRENRENNENQKTEGFDQAKGEKLRNPGTGDYGPRRDRAERYRGGRGGNGGRGGYQGRNFGGYRNDGRDDRGKREFDRRSGSDRSSVKPSDKRDGAGPRNWGTPGNEIEETVEVTAVTEPVGTWQENAETEGTESPKKTEEEGTTEEGAEDKEPKEEEPTEMTLDEWKAQQEQGTQAKPSFNIRRPGEGESQEKWKGMKVLRKVNKDDSKRETNPDDQHKRQTKPQVSVNIQFGDNRNQGFGGRGRGGRGGGRGRGRGGRFGGERMQRQGHQLLPDVQNEQEFPTLG